MAADSTSKPINCGIRDEANDKQQAQPMLTQVLVNTEQIPRTVTMDAGSCSEVNVTALTALGCQPLIPPDRQQRGLRKFGQYAKW
ncbi:MAG: hypothetical protein P0120_23340 [Nitrospira sp.]|nr:hypothetical protein [Nitrospira sp.]